MNIPLSSRALDLLIKRTDADHDGEVSLTYVVNAHFCFVLVLKQYIEVTLDFSLSL